MEDFMSLIEEISNKIYKRHIILEHAEKSLKKIESDLMENLNKIGLKKYKVNTKVKHEVYEIEIAYEDKNYKKIELTYHEIARRLADQIDISENDIKNAIEKTIFDKIKL